VARRNQIRKMETPPPQKPPLNIQTNVNLHEIIGQKEQTIAELRQAIERLGQMIQNLTDENEALKKTG
jgi:hypothetical protein